MVVYAILNENNVCESISSYGKGLKNKPNYYIELDSYDQDYLWRKYENGEWSDKKYVPDYAQIEIDRMEELEESQSDQDDLIMSILLGGE